MNTQYTAVVTALKIYLDGLHHSDTKLLADVFHPGARYICATDDPLLQLNMAEYFPIVDNRPAPHSLGESREAERIVSIEFGGPNMVFARVECAIGPKHFTDFLTLVFVNEKWQIISKVFHYDLRSNS